MTRYWQVVFELSNYGTVIIDYIKAETEDEAKEIMQSRMDTYRQRLQKITRFYEVKDYYLLEDTDLKAFDL